MAHPQLRGPGPMIEKASEGMGIPVSPSLPGSECIRRHGPASMLGAHGIATCASSYLQRNRSREAGASLREGSAGSSTSAEAIGGRQPCSSHATYFPRPGTRSTEGSNCPSHHCELTSDPSCLDLHSNVSLLQISCLLPWPLMGNNALSNGWLL